jgi:hypothetical protein
MFRLKFIKLCETWVKNQKIELKGFKLKNKKNFFIR